MIEAVPNIDGERERDFRFPPSFERAGHFPEENDRAGSTFKAGAKPVWIGTAVVGANRPVPYPFEVPLEF